ncbi:MAG: SH3-like domain-containing protein [Bacteroidetes bacterium]|nr:SH3-like domain-containing protein [Bacteroidota bacterium]
MKFRYSLIVLMLALLVSCKSKKDGDNVILAPGTHRIKVEEVIQTSNYTYLKANEDGKELWLAITKQDVKEGETCYYAQEMEMDNFVSKELKRTFEKIFFVQTFSKQPIAMVNNKPAVSPGSKNASPDKKEIKLAPASGGITLAQLFEKRNSFAGKKVKIHGQVVKVNTQIMGKNWIHIQDGTDFGGDFDLTVTTTTEPKVGDTVTCEGVITLNKDFGAGYSYAVIMEDATVELK